MALVGHQHQTGNGASGHQHRSTTSAASAAAYMPMAGAAAGLAYASAAFAVAAAAASPTAVVGAASIPHNPHVGISSSGSNNNNGGSGASSSGNSSGSGSGNVVSGGSSSSSSGGSSSEPQPDRPIGYGAFGVVWAVTDPRDGRRVALKKMPHVFQSLVACRRVYRELKMLTHFNHENVLSALDVLQPLDKEYFQEIYVLTELMQSDLHKIIVSPQPLTTDHIKLFLYQILRGLKYIHACGVIHRDIKPGNLLVNSNCCLKICDFGLARLVEPEENVGMTQEVVTQYYRAPELLLGARHYQTAIDIWSVGCVFAELISRKILFQASTPLEQVDRIVELLGTPLPEDIRTAAAGARRHMLAQPNRPPQPHRLYALSPTNATEDSVDLLSKMIAFDPNKRISAEKALHHRYLDDGRLRYHSCMCRCCAPLNCTSNSTGSNTSNGGRQFCNDLEPTCNDPLARDSDLRDEHLASMNRIRDRLKTLMANVQTRYDVPLCINPHSAAYKAFVKSQVAQPNELPPSPHVWDNN